MIELLTLTSCKFAIESDSNNVRSCVFDMNLSTNERLKFVQNNICEYQIWTSLSYLFL